MDRDTATVATGGASRIGKGLSFAEDLRRGLY